jgi:putative Mg2+ transporter-C (MgtC) family protein
MDTLPQLADLTFRIFCAIALGAAIGLERQWRLRTAGIRTNALVSVGASLFVIVGSVGLTGPDADPTRVAAQIVSGIGFLGAGVIIRDGMKIRGLTTAATLWCAAAVGSLAGAGNEMLALIGCIAIVGTNTLLRPLSDFVNRRMGLRFASTPDDDDEETVLSSYALEVETSEKSESRVRAIVLQALTLPDITLNSLSTLPTAHSRVLVLARVSAGSPAVLDTLERAVQRISLDPKVVASRWWTSADDD